MWKVWRITVLIQNSDVSVRLGAVSVEQCWPVYCHIKAIRKFIMNVYDKHIFQVNFYYNKGEMGLPWICLFYSYPEEIKVQHIFHALCSLRVTDFLTNRNIGISDNNYSSNKRWPGSTVKHFLTNSQSALSNLNCSSYKRWQVFTVTNFLTGQHSGESNPNYPIIKRRQVSTGINF